MSWSCSISGHSETVKPNDLEAALRKAFEDLKRQGATYIYLSGMTGGEQVAYTEVSAQPSAEPKAE